MLAHLLLWWLVACGFRGPCEELCSGRADCLQAEIDAYDTSWASFTGFDDREAYEAECLGVFEDGRDQDAGRRELRKVCKLQAEEACDP